MIPYLQSFWHQLRNSGHLFTWIFLGICGLLKCGNLLLKESHYTVGTLFLNMLKLLYSNAFFGTCTELTPDARQTNQMFHEPFITKGLLLCSIQAGIGLWTVQNMSITFNRQNYSQIMRFHLISFACLEFTKDCVLLGLHSIIQMSCCWPNRPNLVFTSAPQTCGYKQWYKHISLTQKQKKWCLLNNHHNHCRRRSNAHL